MKSEMIHLLFFFIKFQPICSMSLEGKFHQQRQIKLELEAVRTRSDCGVISDIGENMFDDVFDLVC